MRFEALPSFASRGADHYYAGAPNLRPVARSEHRPSRLRLEHLADRSLLHGVISGNLDCFGLILAAEFVNGWTDAPNAIATVVSTRVVSRASPGDGHGFERAGDHVWYGGGRDIGKDIVSTQASTRYRRGGDGWNRLLEHHRVVLGLPTSESHALIAGLTGAALATAGPESLLWEGWRKVLIGLVFSTFLGFGGGLLLMTIIYRVFANHRPSTITRLFGKLEILSAAFMAFSHGSNDGQKFIGTFTLVLLLNGTLPSFQVPLWVILICAVMMVSGRRWGDGAS